MPLNKPRDPSRYSILFHELIRNGPGDWRMGMVQATIEAADLEARRFAQFRRDLQARPGHRTSQALSKLNQDGFNVRTKIVLTEKGWDVEIRIRRPKALDRKAAGTDLPLLQRLEESLEREPAAGD